MAGQTNIPCNIPGGVQQTLIGPAVITLLIYSLGLPIGEHGEVDSAEGMARWATCTLYATL